MYKIIFLITIYFISIGGVAAKDIYFSSGTRANMQYDIVDHFNDGQYLSLKDFRIEVLQKEVENLDISLKTIIVSKLTGFKFQEIQKIKFSCVKGRCYGKILSLIPIKAYRRRVTHKLIVGMESLPFLPLNSL